MIENFPAEVDTLRARLQSREIFTLMRSDLLEDIHVIPVRDTVQHSESVNCECLPDFARSASTGLTGECGVVIHKQLSEVLA